jgi:serpin B
VIKHLVRAVAALACCFAAVAATPATPVDPANALAQPYARFGFDVLRELRAQSPHRNVFISPTSIAVALAMTANGAGGKTRTDILSTLHAGGMTLDAFNAANRSLAADIAKTTSVRLTMANALWLQQGFSIRPQFTSVARSTFGAQVDNLDFRNAHAVDVVNAWAAKHTDGLIDKVLDTIDPSTVAMIANAIAFKGKWTLQFDPKATKLHDFTTAAGAKKSVHMMSHLAEYAYANAGGTQAIRLPYSDGSFAMYVVLPSNDASLESFVQSLTPASFDALRNSLRNLKGTIQLPRFQLKFDALLNRTLAKLGMSVAFTSSADFSNIHAVPPRLAISEIHHASFLKVDEEGTQAAAVTTVGIRMTAIRVEPPPFAMVVDRPFVVAIRDEHSGALLFLGTVADPQ